jgi:hypothetical protein
MWPMLCLVFFMTSNGALDNGDSVWGVTTTESGLIGVGPLQSQIKGRVVILAGAAKLSIL